MSAESYVKVCPICESGFEPPHKTRLQRKRAGKRQYCSTTCANKAAAGSPEIGMMCDAVLQSPFAMQAKNITIFGVVLRRETETKA